MQKNFISVYFENFLDERAFFVGERLFSLDKYHPDFKYIKYRHRFHYGLQLGMKGRKNLKPMLVHYMFAEKKCTNTFYYVFQCCVFFPVKMRAIHMK